MLPAVTARYVAGRLEANAALILDWADEQTARPIEAWPRLPEGTRFSLPAARTPMVSALILDAAPHAVPTALTAWLPQPLGRLVLATLPPQTPAEPHHGGVLLAWSDELAGPGDVAEAVAEIGAPLSQMIAVAQRHLTAQRRLRAMEAMLHATPVACLAVPMDGGTGEVSYAASQLLGLPEGEVPAREIALGLRRLQATAADAAKLQAEAAALMAQADWRCDDWRWELAGGALLVSSAMAEGRIRVWRLRKG